jgi:hypothetical protein
MAIYWMTRLQDGRPAAVFYLLGHPMPYTDESFPSEFVVEKSTPFSSQK